MKLEDIALRDALRIFLSNYYDTNPSEIMQMLADNENKGLDELEWPDNVYAWEPFENYTAGELYDVIDNAFDMNLKTYKEILPED